MSINTKGLSTRFYKLSLARFRLGDDEVVDEVQDGVELYRNRSLDVIQITKHAKKLNIVRYECRAECRARRQSASNYSMIRLTKARDTPHNQLTALFRTPYPSWVLST